MVVTRHREGDCATRVRGIEGLVNVLLPYSTKAGGYGLNTRVKTKTRVAGSENVLYYVRNKETCSTASRDQPSPPAVEPLTQLHFMTSSDHFEHRTS